MGSSIDIPVAAAPGQLVAKLDLDETDLRITIDRLKSALEKLKQR